MKIIRIKKINILKLFSSEDSRFLLLSATKVAAVYIAATFLLIYFIWIVLSLNNVFFDAYGLNELAGLKTAYFDFILANIMESLSYIFAFYVLLFFLGLYVGKMLMRPFDLIADYCTRAIDDHSAIYNPDSFSDFKLLTRFSDFFFQYILEARRKRELQPNTIPSNFSKIHQPVFDKVFFFHFFLLQSIIAIIAVSSISIMVFEIYDGLISLAVKTFSQNNSSTVYFFRNQEFIFDSVRYFSIMIIIVAYILLSFHLYGKVKGAVFAFFVTMRSFMKGNHEARVHLLEYKHLRPQGRAFNKFLDHICREIKNVETKDSKTEQN